MTSPTRPSRSLRAVAVHHVAVLARDAHRKRSVRVDRRDELGVHLADQHHLHDVHRLVGV